MIDKSINVATEKAICTPLYYASDTAISYATWHATLWHATCGVTWRASCGGTRDTTWNALRKDIQ